MIDSKQLYGKRLLILGGTRISCEIVRIAKELGCFVGVADYNPLEESPAKQIADAAHDVSVLDIESMVRLIRKEHYDGVTVGFADAILPAYADICAGAKLPAYATKSQLELFTQKHLYKALLRKYGIPTVEEYTIDSSDFDETAASICYPVLVKPVDSSGARGITICKDPKELKRAIEKAKSFSRSGTFMVERYIEGREITANWLFKDGKYYLTCVSNRHVKHNQEGVIPLPVGYSYPSVFTSCFQAYLEDKCKRLFHDIGIKDGMMFMQCKVENGIPIVYDVGFRMTGTQEYTNLENVCGYNPIAMMICFALTGSMGEPYIERKIDPTFGGCYGFNVSSLSAPGKIANLTGVEEVREFPEVIRSVIAHYPEETITDSMKGLLAQICVRTMGTVDKKEKLYPTMKRIEETIGILGEDGERMNLPGIEPEDIEGYIL